MIFMLLILSVEEDNFIPRPEPPHLRIQASDVYRIMVKEWVFLLTREPGGFLFLNTPNFSVPYSRLSVDGIEARCNIHLLLLQAGVSIQGRWDSLVSSGFFEGVNPYGRFPFVLNVGYLWDGRMKPTGSITVFYPSGKHLFGLTGGLRKSIYAGVILQFSKVRLTMGKDIAGLMYFDDKGFFRLRYGYFIPPVYEARFHTPEYTFRATTSLDLLYQKTYIRVDKLEDSFSFFVKRGTVEIFYLQADKITGIRGVVERIIGGLHCYAYPSISGRNITTTQEIKGELGFFVKPVERLFPAFGLLINSDWEWRFAIGMGLE